MTNGMLCSQEDSIQQNLCGDGIASGLPRGKKRRESLSTTPHTVTSPHKMYYRSTIPVSPSQAREDDLEKLTKARVTTSQPRRGAAANDIKRPPSELSIMQNNIRGFGITKTRQQIY